jgi:hypothetical protein
MEWAIGRNSTTVSFQPELRAVRAVLMASMKGRRESELVTVRAIRPG